MLHSIKLLGTTITSEREDKILEYVIDHLHNGREKLFITTPNPEILVYAQSHPDYQDKLNEANVALPDGAGLLLGGWVLGKPLRERIAGVDFIGKLCVESREKPVSMGFLGGRDGVAELAAQRLQKKYPWIKVAWVGEEWGSGKNDAVRSSFEESRVEKDQARGGTVGRVHASAQSRSSEHLREGDRDRTPIARRSESSTLHPSRSTPSLKTEIDILFVAYGFPKQEEWIYENLPHLPVKAAMGVGGSFDYISGRVTRAPKVIRVLGLEWLFRLTIQPWRWKRQLALVTFLFLILKDRFTVKKVY